MLRKALWVIALAPLVASVIAMSMWQPCPLWSRWRKASRMFITAGSVPPPMSAISAGGTTGAPSAPAASASKPASAM